MRNLKFFSLHATFASNTKHFQAHRSYHMHSYIAKHDYGQHGMSTHQSNHAFKKKTKQLRDFVTLIYRFTPGNKFHLGQSLIPTYNELEPPHAIYPYCYCRCALRPFMYIDIVNYPYGNKIFICIKVFVCLNIYL